MTYIDVVLPLALTNCLTYSVPDDMVSIVKFGVRVVVPLGKKKIYTGIVIDIHYNKPADYETKEIMSVLDSEPIVTKLQVDVWKWMASYYVCTLGEVMKAAMPSGLKMESESQVLAIPDFVALRQLSKNEQIVMDSVNSEKPICVDELSKRVGVKNVLPVLQRLSDMGAIVIGEELKEKYKPKKEIYVRLTQEYTEEEKAKKVIDKLAKAPKQFEVFARYLSLSKVFVRGESREVSRKELLGDNLATSILNNLVDKGIFEYYDKSVDRIGARTKFDTQFASKLSDIQTDAKNKINSFFINRNVVLLHGVTSCGKTEIYISLMQDCISQGRQVLFLLPEIALTTQITNRLRRVFGDSMAVYHSKFSDNERVEIWNAMLSPEKEYKVILGVRSSVFLPFRNLGLVIVDEEHESTYKQYDPAPRYHARNTAIVLSVMCGAKVLLGSATPSIESYYNAMSGKYGFVEITKRFADVKMPRIDVVDVKKERLRKSMNGSFSPQLIEQMSNALRDNQQVILFQNRRGFAPYMECRSCAFVPRCVNCDVSLTYHKRFNELTCHYCGYTVPVPSVCPACANPTMYDIGLGTEKIEEEVSVLFPESKVARLDLDVAKTRRSYEEIISKFEKGEIQILVGTQMISKGLDFERVKVVGIVRADGMLHYPDFRSHERAYQLMSQVSGRAGRKGTQGVVVLQTSDTEHPVINQVRSNKYKEMYMTQIQERTAFRYPPFYRLIYVYVKGKDDNRTNMAAESLAVLLRNSFGFRVYGPDVPQVTRIQTFNIRKIMLKFELSFNLVSAKESLRKCCTQMMSDIKGVFVQIDVDPM